MPPPAAWPERLLSIRTAAALTRLRGVALYLWLIVVISVRQSTVAAISGLHCRALVMVGSSIRLTAWLQNSKKRAERSEIDVWRSHRDYLRSGYLHHRLPVAWAVNHYRDNAITYKAQRNKNARELKLANAAITDMLVPSAWCCCAHSKTTKS